MLHRAWEDFAVWGWAQRNVVSDAHILLTWDGRGWRYVGTDGVVPCRLGGCCGSALADDH